MTRAPLRFPPTPIAAVVVLCSLMWLGRVAAQPAALRYAAPASPVEYDLRVNLAGTLRVAPAAAGDLPYNDSARFKGEGTARMTVRAARQDEDTALTLFLSSGQGLLEAFDSRLQVALVSGSGGARVTIALNDTEIANEVVGSAPGLGPLGLTLGPQGQLTSAGGGVIEALTAVAGLLTRLPSQEVAAGAETEYTLTATDTAPLTGSVRVRVIGVDEAAAAARLELRGRLALPRRTFRLRLPGPETGEPLWFGGDIERWECETTGRLTMPAGGGLPLVAAGEIKAVVHARLGADSPDWHGRAVRVQGDLKLTYDLRRRGL